MRMIIIRAAVTLMVAGPAAATDNDNDNDRHRVADDGSGWQASTMSLAYRGKQSARGHVLFTTDTDRAGAAFRCHDGKLYAIFSLDAVPIGRYLVETRSRPKNVEMQVSVDDRVPRTETWVSLFNGKLYMARRISTTSELYRAATLGASIDIGREGRDRVRIDLPGAPRAEFEGFLERCDLDDRHAPWPGAAARVRDTAASGDD